MAIYCIELTVLMVNILYLLSSGRFPAAYICTRFFLYFAAFIDFTKCVAEKHPFNTILPLPWASLLGWYFDYARLMVREVLFDLSWS